MKHLFKVFFLLITVLKREKGIKVTNSTYYIWIVDGSNQLLDVNDPEHQMYIKRIKEREEHLFFEQTYPMNKVHLLSWTKRNPEKLIENTVEYFYALSNFVKQYRHLSPEIIQQYITLGDYIKTIAIINEIEVK